MLPRKFYARDTTIVARELVGKLLVRRIGNDMLSGTIMETEAYKDADDPASHAHNGMTKRNRAMFGQVGRAYVYFTYGMHYCFNVVARDHADVAGAVLIRAIKPCRGIEIMRQNRNKNGKIAIADGPAKLAQAMRIDTDMYGIDLTKKSDLYITCQKNDDVMRINTAPRVGISRATERRWNYSLVS